MEKEKEIIVLAPNGCHDYLTSNKEYIALDFSIGLEINSFSVVDDEGDTIYCIENGCSHLKGQNWIIKSE